MESILNKIKDCTRCEAKFHNIAGPVVSANEHSRIVIISDAPSREAYEKGEVWDHQSKEILQKWLNIDSDSFNDPDIIAFLPMSFCNVSLEGTELPPRKECAPRWHDLILQKMSHHELVVLIGPYAQRYYLNAHPKISLTENIKNFKAYLPKYIPVPDPSSVDEAWMNDHPWFGNELLPALQERVQSII